MQHTPFASSPLSWDKPVKAKNKKITFLKTCIYALNSWNNYLKTFAFIASVQQYNFLDPTSAQAMEEMERIKTQTVKAEVKRKYSRTS